MASRLTSLASRLPSVGLPVLTALALGASMLGCASESATDDGASSDAAAFTVSSGESFPCAFVAEPSATTWIECTKGGRIRRASGGAVTTIATAPAGDEPLSMTADATHVYWASMNGYLRRVPRAGGAIETLALGRQSGIGPQLFADESPSGFLYVAGAGGFAKVPKSGGPITPIVTLPDAPFGARSVRSFATDAASFYLVVEGADPHGDPASIVKLPRSGAYPADATVLVPAVDYAGPVRVDATHVYFTQNLTHPGTYTRTHAAFRVAKSGGRAAKLVEFPSEFGYAHGFDVGERLACAGNFVEGKVRCFDKTGGNHTAVAGVGSIDQVSLVGGRVVWNDRSRMWNMNEQPFTGAMRTAPLPAL